MIYLISVFGGLILMAIGYQIGITIPNRKYETLDINNAGETLVTLILKKHFKKEDNYLINNVTIPINEEGTSQIDHILINQYGIFVIETKHYSGWIFGREEDYKWTQSFPNGKKYKFYNPIKQNKKHIEELYKKIDNIEINLFRSIIVFSSDAEIKTNNLKNVIYINSIKKHIEDYKLKVLNKDEIYKIIGAIEFNKKEANQKTEIDHIDYLKRKHKEKT